MTSKPFLIDAVVGNSNMLVTLTKNAEIQRLFWPNVDGGQHVERLLGGVSLDESPVIWQTDDRWEHSQVYEPDQNVLVTSSAMATGLQVITTDASTPGRDILVRQLTFTNGGAASVSLRYVLYQWFRFDENPLYNTALFDEQLDALVHFRKDLFIAAGADRPMADVGVGYARQVLQDASELSLTGGSVLHSGGGTVLHGDVAGAALWDLGALAPGESATLALFLVMGHNRQHVQQLLAEARTAGAPALLDGIRSYWTDWLARARPLNVAGSPIQAGAPTLPGIPQPPAAPADVEALYRRSLLVFKLLSDEKTGAVIAAPEFDPAYTACGGYAYCWGRDAAYITTAMDLAGYHDLAASFYRWAVGAQEPEGWWMHRHYSSGHWGPSWGLLQIDETGSILFGMALHARLHGGEAFIRSVWDSVSRAANWLAKSMDPDTGLAIEAVDLWEERTAQLIYSSGAVYAGLKAAAEMAAAISQTEAAERWESSAAALQQAIMAEGVREGRFLRGRFLQVSPERYRQAQTEGKVTRVRTAPKGHPVYEVDEDPVSDSSLLGMSVPFAVVPPAHPVMVSTAERLVEDLWTAPAGGMRRYVGDHYRTGNPWILCTLWLGLYQAERGDAGQARQLLDWAVARRNGAGLLAEQVDPVTGEPVWVVPLTWSHAMYVLLALKLFA